jgi:hypothetical protein
VPRAPRGAIPGPRHPTTPQDLHRRVEPPDGDAHAQSEPTTERGPHPLPGEEDNPARAWGRAQAAAAPRWSAAKRQRMAHSFGVTLPEDPPR